MTISPSPAFRRRRLYDELISSLREDERLIVNGELVKNKIVELALNMDRKLLELLLSNDAIKDEFFSTLDNCFIFDKIKFQNFVTNKQFLPDSYTAFGIKIGLQSNATYLSESDDVVLAWPYKDCVLEGGQTKEDEKRNEIFWNETLAPDEIDVLLEPKVLTNFKKFDNDGEKEVDSISVDDNLIIKGNNLLVLHSLKRQLGNKVRLIYIDPPYNTGGEANIFTYNNNFNHSTWLTFMKNRLSIAKEFLRNDGFLVIAIDHNELLYLGVMADEIFGRGNRLGIISVMHHPAGKTNDRFFATTNEYMLVYAKDAGKAELGYFPMSEGTATKYKYEDRKSKYKLEPIMRKGETRNARKEDRPNQHYPVYVKSDLSRISLDYKDGFIEVWPIEDGRDWIWSFAPSTLEKKIKAGEIVVENDRTRQIPVIKVKKRINEYKGQKPRTTWNESKYNATVHGTNLLKELLGGIRFSYPKSLYSVKDVILDFFAGSGTTGHATISMNQEDGGNRKFILVEQLEEHASICRERIQAVLKNSNIDSSFISCELTQLNEKFLEQTLRAESKQSLNLILQQIQSRNFVSYQIKPESIIQVSSDLDALPLDDQKRFLLAILDKNQLYLNLSEMEDEDYEVAELDKSLNRQFYAES